MANNKKKPISITLVAALVLCLITFIAGFVISSFAMLDSRLEAANEKANELKDVISEKEARIEELNDIIDQKDKNNIILGDKIQLQQDTIDSLTSEVNALQSDVSYISQAAIDGTLTESALAFISFDALSLSQKLLFFFIIFVILILIISIACVLIARAASSKKEKKSTPELLNEEEPENEQNEPANDEIAEADEPAGEEEPENDNPTADDTSAAPTASSVVDRAIDLLYHNNLEDSISDLSGFKFGITNFDEVLSDKSKGKSFGNSDNGDFVAFMSASGGIRRLYIIPRHLTLSDSTVALRGVIDLFNVVNEAGSSVTHGTVKIKTVDAPAVFACGENGWAIESKGKITALGTKTY